VDGPNQHSSAVVGVNLLGNGLLFKTFPIDHSSVTSISSKLSADLIIMICKIPLSVPLRLHRKRNHDKQNPDTSVDRTADATQSIKASGFLSIARSSTAGYHCTVTSQTVIIHSRAQLKRRSNAIR
jgi:hypothetical protein